MSRPYRTYFGGKEGKGVYQAIINQIPPHNIYAELFVGNGSIFRKKKKAGITLLCDLSPKVVCDWEKQGVQKVNFTDWNEWDYGYPELSILNDNAMKVLRGDDWFGIPSLDVKGCFIYLDPPYPIESRKQKRAVYEYEMTIPEHIQLLEVISSFEKSQIMISSYPNDLYDNALKSWRKVDFIGRSQKGATIERIYMNYSESFKLHDYSYVGQNFRDRFRIKKSTDNIVDKFLRLPPLQRNAVLDAVLTNLDRIDDNT